MESTQIAAMLKNWRQRKIGRKVNRKLLLCFLLEGMEAQTVVNGNSRNGGNGCALPFFTSSISIKKSSLQIGWSETSIGVLPKMGTG